MSVRSLQFRRLSLLALFAGLVFDVASAAEPVIDYRKPPAGSVERLALRGRRTQGALDLHAGRRLYGGSGQRQRAPAVPEGRAARLDQGPQRLLEEHFRGTRLRRRVVPPARRRVAGTLPPGRCVRAGALRHLAIQADEVIATYFETDLPTLIAERGDQTSLMFQERSAKAEHVRRAQRVALGASGPRRYAGGTTRRKWPASRQASTPAPRRRRCPARPGACGPSSRWTMRRDDTSGRHVELHGVSAATGVDVRARLQPRERPDRCGGRRAERFAAFRADRHDARQGELCGLGRRADRRCGPFDQA